MLSGAYCKVPGVIVVLESKVSILADKHTVLINFKGTVSKLKPEVDAGLALRPSLGTFAVACPQGSSTSQTARLRLSAGVAGDVVLTSGAEGPTFSAESQVFVGQRRVEPRDVRVLGRGRLAVRVRPDRALRPGIYAGRVITPDQPDLTFEVAVEKRGEQ